MGCEHASEGLSMASDGGGSFGGSGGMSPQRQYNAAMASRMRQRRMRRMKEHPSGVKTIESFGSAAERAEPAKDYVEHYGQLKSSSMSGDLPAGHPISSISDPPPPPPPMVQQNRVPHSIFSLSDASLPPLPPPQATNIGTRKKKSAQVTFNEDDFIPNLQSGLSEDEVRDAANYTSIQFNCSSTSGEVEVLDENSSMGAFDVSGGYFDSWKNEVWSDSGAANAIETQPLSNEIFQQKDAANMVSLITPLKLSRAGLMFPEVNKGEDDETPDDVKGDSPTGLTSPDAPGLSHVDHPGSSRGGEWRGTQLFDDDIDEDVRQSMVFQALRKKMVKPSPQLEELLKQIHRDFHVQIDRAFATRRKNACGALKILVAKEENRLQICWSTGVLAAIMSVLQDVHAEIQDEQSRLANIEARNRIVSALLNLSVNKKNRLLIVNTPGLLDSVAQTILNDEGEGRQGCCTVLLYLSKTAETRSAIARSGGLMDAITKVIEVPKWISPQQITENADVSCALSNHSHDLDRHNNKKVQNKKKSVTVTISFEKFVDTSVPVEIDYDLDPNKFLHGARLTSFACLLCLVKSKETVAYIAKEEAIVEALIGVSRKFSSPSHARALAILAHLTRHPQNCHLLVFKNASLLPLLQEATSSPNNEARRYALCALQNLSIDTSCRASVAHTPNMIKSLTNRLQHSDSKGELVAAIATLQNLADEPANLIQFTIVTNCIASIIEVARSDDSGEKETDVASFLAKNTLATLSHWFRKIATSGSERVAPVRVRGPHVLHSAVFETLTFKQWR